MRIQRISAAALALGLLAGCSAGRGIYANYRPIEDLLPVETLGLDAEDGALWLSAAAQTGAEDARALDARAPGLVQGLAALQDRAGGGRLFFSHCQNFVLGEDFALAGVGGLFDYVERDIHTRMGTHLFVLRSGAAAPLVAGGDVSALLAAVRSETDARGDSHVFDLRETAVALSEQGAALICALRLVQGEDADESLSAVPAGFGILVGGRLAGYLDGGEARAACLLLGVLGSAALEAETEAGAATVILRCGAPEIHVLRGAGGALTVEVSAAPELELAAAAGGADWTDPACQAALTAAVNETLRGDMATVLARDRAMGADFLGLTRALRRAGVDPAALPPDWPETAEFEITVESTLTRSDGLGAPLGVSGGGT